jgi:hypothetical protein
MCRSRALSFSRDEPLGKKRTTAASPGDGDAPHQQCAPKKSSFGGRATMRRGASAGVFLLILSVLVRWSGGGDVQRRACGAAVSMVIEGGGAASMAKWFRKF